ncbi:TetR/AcrR family transcriptional regulator [Sulfitobacter sp. M57]|uniref:TetR/AcrR family transcriptional regulator n=1 Tax=unclassified Sulfitobacter TaxID=196795 RepID=UPI0023E09050|nr:MULTISPECIES: TetR/AcrR family transcriptional regulator [unclassified Sulfitobacter]MDF3413577.1 TetR/AcrR family transcriptional regulator [Sulfitobacter sp. KE5]MDF3421141.1 TetR/AcrR family transcriptional regulator [Sulfitobacter sp. KE43]MDF3432124.1 TetR/AcrR family transcriptional regulator [Sulfitobacter sp. KE42]MDF3457764.1 TetR/AcrR family transcriptional regulator [Sulfitobacter sp. S74]MDF3461665.1 TetR/AcrR family transcriptional regulator [Sulfitobacter sp. Ks18]
MSKPVQKRSQATRAKLVEAARKVILSNGFGEMRVEDVVKEAGVAKGTFFAHFPDKDVLMDLLIGTDIAAHLQESEALPPPAGLEDLVNRLLPLMEFMTSERYVFDVILRHSGAAAKEEVGPIANTFDQQVGLLENWLADGPFRRDVPPLILAEGIQAFAVQSMALQFCAISSEEPMRDRLMQYLAAWLMPQPSGIGQDQAGGNC